MIVFKNGMSNPTILFENFAFLFGAGILDGLSAGNNHNKIRALVEKKEELHLENLRREEMIKKKSKEISRQQLLTTQFSPQVCKMVYNGVISLDQPLKRSNITVCVIDIVNSTGKMAELDPRKSRIVIEVFFDVVTKCFLHWDLTIDKFTGDGVMALANAPKAQEDHSLRCVKACFEVMRSIDEQRNQLEALWGGSFDVRFGIHRGDATVGFIGSDQMRSYTAIGKSVSLAHRLCDKAPINTILITEETFREVVYYDPTIEGESGPFQSFKGFENTKFNTRVLHAPHLGAGSDIDSICEMCGGPLYVESLPNGTMGLMCRNCDDKEVDLRRPAMPSAA
jgi:class 3 adenylate cyclase